MKYSVLTYLFLFFISLGNAQNIFHKDDLTILADSLHLNGNYQEAINIREKAIRLNENTPDDYKAYLKAKYYHSKSAYFEFKSYNYHNPDKLITKKASKKYLEDALKSAIKARDLYINVKHPDKMFQYQLQNRIYHQTAYLGNWKHALEQAQLGYNFLKDTLSINHKTYVDLIYDIGFIYSELGDYTKAVENYQSSLNLYQNIIGDNKNDIAQAYNNIAVEYRNLGLRRMELESLLKAKTIWEDLNDDKNQHFLYSCYGNLFYWYSYYGDFDKAEEYILKKNKLRTAARTTSTNNFLRNNEEVYKDKLSEWYDLMLHYSRKKDTVKTIYYAENILKSINFKNKLLGFEVKTLGSTLKFYASLIDKKDSEKALLLLDRAIDVQEKHKDIFYTKSFPFQLYKVELLLKSKKYSEAELLLNHLNDLNDKQEISNRFKLAILNAKTAQALHRNEIVKDYFDNAFLILKNANVDIESIALKDLKPLISFEIIEGFLSMGDFYFQLYKQKHSNENLKKATHRYLLGAEIYNRLYLGKRYNENLFTTYNAINWRLLDVALEQPNDVVVLSEIINIIENNSSKLTWSKFIFNNHRQRLNIPKYVTNKEESIKAQLNFYQTTLIGSEEEAEVKIKLWKDKIHNLKNDLSEIQDSIKKQSKTYYQFNVKNFEIANLQNSLKADEAIIKYIFSDNFLHSFIISKDAIKLLPKTNRSTVLNSVKTCLNSLKQINHDYEAPFNELKTLLFSQINYQNYKKLTIIPDGALNYFPFEALLLDKKMPLIGYASSLLLFQEQKMMTSTFENLKIGAFSVANGHSKLPKISYEVNSILGIFNGRAFLNASKTDFLENANKFNVLHLAMHSNINEAYPEFSSLNFYGENDNRLFISELYNETLNANMAVLSACDTGSGFYENGEGVISLSRAFNFAGIPSTVVSLWKVDDEATAKIMTSFYKHLSQGETKDEALKNAKLDYLKNSHDPLLKHPYYWSGFVVTGNTDAIVTRPTYWIYLFLIPLMVVGVFSKQLFQFLKKRA